MGAFALCFNRRGEPVQPAGIEGMMRQLSIYGIDGSDIQITGTVAMGCQYFWTTPEDIGARQPIKHDTAPLWLLFEGRIDNRQELYTKLSGQVEPLPQLSDARLFLYLYGQQGEKCLPAVIGPFAAAVYDQRNQTVTIARDAVGGRSISYYVSDEWFIVSTHDHALEGNGEVPIEPNYSRLTLFLGMLDVENPSTFIKDVTYLYPGDVMVVGQKQINRKQFWFPDPTARLKLKSDEEYAECFRDLLTQSVVCRMRAPRPLAVMMSGGLDSSPAAALAADHIVRSNENTRVKGISWVFNKYSECDERKYMDALYDRFLIDPVHVNCDDAWPFWGEEDWPAHPSTPEQTPYREMHERAYRASQDSGARVMLSGMSGDCLYTGTETIIYELLKSCRLVAAISEAWRGRLKYPNFEQLVKAYFIRPTKVYRIYRQYRPVPWYSHWITDFSRAQLEQTESWLSRKRRNARRPHQYSRVMDLFQGHGNNFEQFYTAPYKTELRYPFRDRRLVEFMLQIPTIQLEYAGVRRPIIRRALSGLLPDIIRTRSDKTSFLPVFLEGIDITRKDFVDKFVNNSDSQWEKFIHKWYIRRPDGPWDEQQLVCFWNCVSFEYWRRHTSLGARY